MNALPYQLAPLPAARLGLLVLQSDETLESDFRRLIPQDTPLYVARLPSAPEVSPESLAAHPLRATAALLPPDLSVVGYGCTSGTANVGVDHVAEQVGANTVTEPVSALIAACRAVGIRRLAFLSPYIASVSAPLRQVLRDAGIETPVFASFDEPTEERVARIAPESIAAAARTLVHTPAHTPARTAAQETPPIDGVFLSCTNLNTLSIIEPLEAELGLPVLSSNLVLAWHMLQLAELPSVGIGRLFDPS